MIVSFLRHNKREIEKAVPEEIALCLEATVEDMQAGTVHSISGCTWGVQVKL